MEKDSNLVHMHKSLLIALGFLIECEVYFQYKTAQLTELHQEYTGKAYAER